MQNPGACCVLPLFLLKDGKPSKPNINPFIQALNKFIQNRTAQLKYQKGKQFSNTLGQLVSTQAQVEKGFAYGDTPRQNGRLSLLTFPSVTQCRP